jgi:hypothetical protein
MVNIFELTPTNGRKSFYGKAKVIVSNNVAKLVSYNTVICELNLVTNEFKQIESKLTNTTTSHLKAFKSYYSI